MCWAAITAATIVGATMGFLVCAILIAGDEDD